jgi:hypothetical protein
MTIKEFYLNNYPTDELGIELNENVTFSGLLNELFQSGDIYRYLNVWDSLVRERLFTKLSEDLYQSSDYVYNLWLK